MADSDIAWVAGVPETTLTPAVHARLPASAPAAPWECRCDMLLWTTRATRAATDAVPDPVRRGAQAWNVVAGFVSYHDTPVGRYDEVFGAVGFRSGRSMVAHVGFMSVDSPSSLVGGRTNWGMPKTLAAFSGDFTGRFAATNVAGPSWRIGAVAPKLPWGPAIPIRTAFTVRQLGADGQPHSVRLALRGRARAGWVCVDAEGDFGLAEWICPGPHLAVRLTDATFRLSEPQSITNP